MVAERWRTAAAKRNHHDETDSLSPGASAVSLTDLNTPEKQAIMSELGPAAESTTKQEEENPERTHGASTVALCICMLTHSYLLISVFPYSGYMALHLLQQGPRSDTIHSDNVGSYAGLLAAAFMTGRAATSVGWGRAADRVGRVTVLYWSLGLSCVLSVAFGLTNSFGMALAVRFLLGLSNGIMSAIKTLVSESSTDQASEAKTMSIVMGMWGAGFLLCPILSGALAEPHRQYPDQAWLQRDERLGALLQAYPFVLPNFLGAALCLLAMGAVRAYVEETLPPAQAQSVGAWLFPVWSRQVSSRRAGHWWPFPFWRMPWFSNCPSYMPLENAVVSSSSSSKDNGAMDRAQDDDDASPARKQISMRAIWSRAPTRRCLAIYWVYSFCGLTIDEAFPLYCLNTTAGLGLKEVQIGKILSLCGLLFVVCQYPLYQSMYRQFGLLGSVRKAALLATPSLFAMPLSVVMQQQSQKGTLPWSVWAYLGTCMALYRVMAYVFFTSISVAINRTVPATERATMNGLSLLGGSVAKALGPAFAGVLVSMSVSWLQAYGSLLIFGTVGALVAGVMVATHVGLPDALLVGASFGNQSSSTDDDKDDGNEGDLEDSLSGERIALVERKA